MITGIWIWYDPYVGGMPIEFAAIAMGGPNVAFVNFYEWSEVHAREAPRSMRGFLLRPLFPYEWTGADAMRLLDAPGVQMVEVSGVVWGSPHDKLRLSHLS